MFMMIFVDDLAGAGEIVPDWMVHFSDRHPKGSGMTFVDLVFPAFLFLVGMSVPFALGARIAVHRHSDGSRNAGYDGAGLVRGLVVRADVSLGHCRLLLDWPATEPWPILKTSEAVNVPSTRKPLLHRLRRECRTCHWLWDSYNGLPCALSLGRRRRFRHGWWCATVIRANSGA
jgi:hypothetical protein